MCRITFSKGLNCLRAGIYTAVRCSAMKGLTASGVQCDERALTASGPASTTRFERMQRMKRMKWRKLKP